MKKDNKKKKGMSVGKKIAIGAGVVAVGTGAYYLLGPNSKAHQKKVSGLISKMKKEIIKETGKMKNKTEVLYHNVIDSISKSYNKQYKEHAGEINAFAKKLKGEWKDK